MILRGVGNVNTPEHENHAATDDGLRILASIIARYHRNKVPSTDPDDIQETQTIPDIELIKTLDSSSSKSDD